MMWSCCREGGEEEDQFFDTREEISSVSDSGSDCFDDFNCGHTASSGPVNLGDGRFDYEIWTKNPVSVEERRQNFFDWLGLSMCKTSKDEHSGDSIENEAPFNVDRVRERCGAVLANSDSKHLSSLSWPSFWACSSETRDSLEDNRVSEENVVCKIRNLDDGTEFIVDQLEQDGILGRLREVGSDRFITAEQFHSEHGFSHLVHQFMQRETDAQSIDSEKSAVNRVRNSWLRKLGSVACVVDRHAEFDNLEPDKSLLNGAESNRVRKIRVHQSKKRSKELSALYVEQEIHAHKGSILTMKFSPDGEYLASAGEDGVVRVWRVSESERPDEDVVPYTDSSSMYFRVSQSSELTPIVAEKAKRANSRASGEPHIQLVLFFLLLSSVYPKNLFTSFMGILCLLSSSTDKTVRLWKIGFDECQRVFSHNNYVTCIQFNPQDDNYFISGSIDGKVRIWNISGCRVVDWTDIKEIVTAVCYRPDGQGCIVGSMLGNCCFYGAADVSDNQLQLEVQICLQSKKKAPGKRITGFQFSPKEPSKLMVTSADSQVRILDGVDIIGKYRGFRNTGSQISASFMSDGKHIVSASEDSNVYVWNYNSQDGSAPSHAKSTWSCEHFFSSNVSVAIPWCGIRSGNSISSTATGTELSHIVSQNLQARCQQNMWNHQNSNANLSHAFPLSLPQNFPLGQGLFLEVLPKGTATWPEEKLPVSSPLAMSPAICKSQYKFLKSSCQNTFTSPNLWGQVIVTASLDGRIRSFHNYGLPLP
ncbi:hypothetical protein Syun_007411 [Stephania yunnanensis]|uniref:WD repeat-containing protein 44 n=1 Tax=Stephania yunnanensis TaxID=152371 RepID=A0AAP0L115_9MAGN